MTADDVATVLDGWQNLLTGFGLAARDKRLGGTSGLTYEPDTITQTDAENIWRGDDMAARIVETLPAEMCRAGYTFKIQPGEGGDAAKAKEQEEGVVARMEELGALATLQDALCYERAYGGAAILLGADDGQRDLTKPLNLERVKTFGWMTLLSPSEIQPQYWYTDPRAPKFGTPEIWQIDPQAQGSAKPGNPVSTEALVSVHESRLILFRGIQVSRQQVQEQQGFGDSVLVRTQQVISDFHQSWGAAGVLVQDFSQAVFKIAGLAKLMASNGEAVVQARLQLLDLSRSVLKAALIDKEEDFERKTTPMSGLADILDKFAVRLAAAADMPVTRLMGQSPAGMDATGESDISFWDDRVAAEQEKKLRSPLERVLRLVMLAKDGPTGGKEPEIWSASFNPLRQPTAKERAEERKIIAETDVAYIREGVLYPEEVAASRFGGDGYSAETTIDVEGRQKILELEQAKALEKAEKPDPEPPQVPQPGQEGAEAAPEGEGEEEGEPIGQGEPEGEPPAEEPSEEEDE
jgi:phage-related protein (TIGR01555 family)